MRTVWIREYTWGLSQNVFSTLKAAQDFDCFDDELIRIVEFMEVES